MKFRHSVPILYSSDVRKSIQYYTEVLCFDAKWEWDDPPSFGGVSKDLVEIFFCKDGQGHRGTWIAVMTDDVDDLHQKIKEKGGKIIAPPEDKEWGLREMLVEDPDEHIIRFGSPCGGHHEKSKELPDTIKIIERLPTPGEFEELVKAVGRDVPFKEQAVTILKAPLFAAVAEETTTNKIIGCVLLLGDGASFYYVKDMIVHPEFQSKHIGTALMKTIDAWLEKNAPAHALVGLYTGESLAPFYQQFGFRPAFGMSKRI